MDCCNYMQYRHHQPYYGSQYYEPLPTYHGDFYGQQMYQDYYGNTPYYPQQWPCTTTFPDYVYNPKEARIRKAMRDATRDRSIGASPMLARPNFRRAPHNNWLPPHEDLMMSQLGPPICGGFPLPPNGNNQFMSTMTSGGYTKLEPSRLPQPASMSSSCSSSSSSSSSNTTLHTDYNMQPNPLAQLQQHTEMWHDYQTMRPRSSGNSYMMPEISSYHSNTNEMNNMMIEKQQQNLGNNTSVQTTASLSDCSMQEKNHEVGDFVDGRTGLDGTQNANSQDHFMTVFEQNAKVESRFDPIEDHNSKAKKPRSTTPKKQTTKPLPDFNEAFGSTERGRFQSIPDARLGPNKGYLDYFFDNNSPIKFDDYQI